MTAVNLSDFLPLKGRELRRRRSTRLKARESLSRSPAQGSNRLTRSLDSLCYERWNRPADAAPRSPNKKSRPLRG